MHRYLSLQSPLRRIGGVTFAFAFAALAAIPAHSQFGEPETTTVHDASALTPPPGARVAIIEFEDMQCPDCARANPMLKDAAADYNIPWVRHDFPLPQHNWSFQAAVNARFLDTVSKTLGNDYRDEIFLNQPSIETSADLDQFTQRFASQHGVTLPSPVDPTGSFAQLVKADLALGQRIGIEHTPTIWIVTNSSHGAPFVEVVDRSRLYQLIDQAMAETRQ